MPTLAADRLGRIVGRFCEVLAVSGNRRSRRCVFTVGGTTALPADLVGAPYLPDHLHALPRKRPLLFAPGAAGDEDDSLLPYNLKLMGSNPIPATKFPEQLGRTSPSLEGFSVCGEAFPAMTR